MHDVGLTKPRAKAAENQTRQGPFVKPEQYSEEAEPSKDGSSPESVVSVSVRQGTVAVYEEKRQEDHNNGLAQDDN
ncbi:hypothetical protein Tco_0625609 [Tanacetum coccineum]|uniref:Seed maturation protein n=1 Tax=Tanacetum coccineum TaxID=301880 RepID=A0ABQ4WH88_9ASTR